LQEYAARLFLVLDAVHRLPIWIFKKIQIGGKGNVIQLWQRRKEMAALERSRRKATMRLGR